MNHKGVIGLINGGAHAVSEVGRKIVVNLVSAAPPSLSCPSLPPFSFFVPAHSQEENSPFQAPLLPSSRTLYAAVGLAYEGVYSLFAGEVGVADCGLLWEDGQCEGSMGIKITAPDQGRDQEGSR